MLTPLEVTERMLDWFADEAHWVKGSSGIRSPQGQVAATCLAGGVSYAILNELRSVGWLPAERELRREVVLLISTIVHEQYPERTDPVGPVPMFNDHPDTTIADVRAVLEKVRGRLQEKADAS